jgi:pimeloyl-ACP methyl ester carboxylesterase
MSIALFRIAAAIALAGASAGALAAPFESSRISVRTEGIGPDVILVPGLSSSPRVWAGMVEAVPGYRYHLVQVSGFAGQPKDGNTEGKVVAPVAEEIDRYIREASLKRPAVIGHEMGGTVGIMLATRHPADLSRLMVVDMTPFHGMFLGGPNATVENMEPVADRIAAWMRAEAPEDRSRHAADTLNRVVNAEAMRPGALDDSLRSDVDVFIRAYHELIVTNLIPELDKITVPVTVLYAYPKGIPVPVNVEHFDSAYQRTYAPLKDVVLKRVPDSGPFIMWDQPARFQQEVKAFLGTR